MPDWSLWCGNVSPSVVCNKACLLPRGLPLLLPKILAAFTSDAAAIILGKTATEAFLSQRGESGALRSISQAAPGAPLAPASAVPRHPRWPPRWIQAAFSASCAVAFMSASASQWSGKLLATSTPACATRLNDIDAEVTPTAHPAAQAALAPQSSKWRQSCGLVCHRFLHFFLANLADQTTKRL